MPNSVNTNVGAMIALQNLNSTQAELMQVQGRISTGKKVASAKEGAKLTSLHTRQQLGVQALSIANQSPQVLMSLFR